MVNYFFDRLMNLMDRALKQLVQLFKLIDQGEYLTMILASLATW
jgi:hypothetical protein